MRQTAADLKAILAGSGGCNRGFRLPLLWRVIISEATEHIVWEARQQPESSRHWRIILTAGPRFLAKSRCRFDPLGNAHVAIPFTFCRSF